MTLRYDKVINSHSQIYRKNAPILTVIGSVARAVTSCCYQVMGVSYGSDKIINK